MPYLHRHIYLRAGGHFGQATTALEQWSVGLRFGALGADIHYDRPALQTFCDAAATAFSNLQGLSTALTGGATYLDWTTAARVGLDGKYDPVDQITVRKDLTPVSGGGTTVLPYPAALVVSLRTSLPRGPASNGRMYLPAGAAPITATTGKVSDTAVNTRLAQVRVCLDALNVAAAAYAANMRLMVMSAVGGGKEAIVTSIRSDGRVDGIERRENRLAVTYSTQPIA